MPGTAVPTEPRRTAQQWVDQLGYDPIHDPDGWRHDDGVTLETRITRKEFERRYSECTIMRPKRS